MKIDTIFADAGKRTGDFRFDDDVADVFPDMISRSVPGYGSILSMIGQLAERFVVPHSSVYDLGCSLGAATLLIRQRIPNSCRIHAVDNSAAMIRRLRARLAAEEHAPSCCPVEIHLADVTEIPLTDASFCLLNFTLQFIPTELREPLLANIFQALRPGGALLLSEKICVAHGPAHDLLTDLHEDFKRANGYSELEIAQKRSALERTLIPETVDTHVARLRNVGFDITVPWFQCFNFVSLLAVKT